MMGSVQAVLFDFYATLSDPSAEPERRAASEPVAAALGVEPAAFWAAAVASYDERARGTLGDTRASLRELARRCGAVPNGIAVERALTLHYRAYASIARPHPAALGLLADLRRTGWRVGVLTDCSTELAELWPELPWSGLVEAVTFSAVLGTRKPDPLGYRQVASRLGVRPEACWFVGDGGNREHAGATAVGMRPVLVTNAAYGVADLRMNADPDRPADVVDDLAEVRTLLGAPTPD
ncbi:MAG: hypothetical protein JWP61_2915 [Friedmanniella sp.]|nr:hypothetical protein [Friedmanniella sp.]